MDNADNLQLNSGVATTATPSMVIPRRTKIYGRVGSSITTSHKDYMGEVRIATYSRVSTLHSEQVAAFSNQVEFTRGMLAKNPNWKLIDEYSDMGLSGTQTKHRDGFNRMIEDAKKGKFDLIVTREISRFSRNLVDTLSYSRMLRNYGVEIYFVNDGIFSWDPDGELRMSLLGALSQDASRHTSERVLSGQQTSRERNFLYGSGNLFGFQLVKTPKGESNKLIIDQEQADTVKLIYDMYLREEKGYKAICSELMAMKKPNPSGKAKWDDTQVRRILSRRVYSGFLVYGQTICVDFLTHKRKNLPQSEHIYVKADPSIIPPIIPDEDWQAAKARREATTTRQSNKPNRGKPRCNDKWAKKLRCSCGDYTYKKFVWRKNAATQEVCYGYQCRNQIVNRSKKWATEHGVSTENRCDVPCVAEWKLDIQFYKLLERIWNNPEETVDTLVENIIENYEEYEERKSNPKVERLNREKERLENRKTNLLDLRLDDAIDKDAYNKRSVEIQTRLDEIETELALLVGESVVEPEEVVEQAVVVDSIKAILDDVTNLSTSKADYDLVDKTVAYIIPCEGYVYKWYIDLGEKVMTGFDEKQYTFYDRFTIDFAEARAYRKAQPGHHFLRANQWNDITTEIYIRL